MNPSPIAARSVPLLQWNPLFTAIKPFLERRRRTFSHAGHHTSACSSCSTPLLFVQRFKRDAALDPCPQPLVPLRVIQYSTSTTQAAFPPHHAVLYTVLRWTVRTHALLPHNQPTSPAHSRISMALHRTASSKVFTYANAHLVIKSM